MRLQFEHFVTSRWIEDNVRVPHQPRTVADLLSDVMCAISSLRLLSVNVINRDWRAACRRSKSVKHDGPVPSTHGDFDIVDVCEAEKELDIIWRNA